MIQFFPSRPVAFDLLGFEIHWYGLLYLAGFLIAAAILPRLQKYRNLSLNRDDWMTLLSWSVGGVIVGGRLGYVFFYEPQYFWENPTQIVAVWLGGMSFHGGLLGVILVLFFFTKKHRVSLLALADVIVIPVAIGLALGRFGNFINQELYGTVTTLPWGMVFPGAEGLRHPTQLYAVGKDFLIAALCFWYLQQGSPSTSLKAGKAESVKGRTAALFLILYGVGRFLMEFLREQQYPLIDLGILTLTRGQALTIPVFVIGVLLWIQLSRAADKGSS